MIQKISRKVFLYSVFAFAVFTIAIPYKASSGPAYDGLFEIKQPSGHTFKAKKRGDEWHHWVETEDGYGIYKNRKTNCWEYYLPSNNPEKPKLGIEGAEDERAIVGDADPVSRNIPKRLRPAKIKKPETELHRQEKSQKAFERKSKSTAVSGAMKLLVIGVQYEDHPATYSANDIQSLIFGENSSISDYFNDVSYGAVTIEPASESHGTSNDGFIGWLQLSGNHPNTGSTDYQTAENAIIAADDYIDFASYDADGDGYVESTELAVLIIVAGYAAEYGDGDYEPSVWGYTHLGVAATIEGKNIDGYSMVGEKHEDHLGTIGPMVHELGHLIFDLPDLYDTDKDNGDSYGIGDFGLMGSGNWGAKYGENPGSSPTHPCAWSKEYLSWGTANTINSSQTISLPKADGNSSSAFRLDTSDPDQYFLIENRQFSGYDIGFQRLAGSSGHGGIVIYHIDTSKADMRYDVNADENDKGVDVEEANEGSVGYSMLDTYEKAAHTNMFYFSGNNDSFSNSTTPNSRLKNNNSTYIAITGISSYGDTMSAYATRPPTATTGSVTNIEPDSATLNGTVNPYGEETTVWFEYGATSGSYSNTTSTQNISGSGEISVSSDISGLMEGITYYYRIVVQNSIGTIYGDEKSFESFVSITTTPMIAGGDYHSMALKSDGTVWTWGDNSYGQLGDGSTTDRYTPVQVSNLSGVTAIAAGGGHSLALKYDGTVWAWGDNSSGQLGDGTYTERSTPVQVSGLSGVTAIAGGGDHSIALKSDGTMWVWGPGVLLGVDTSTNSTTPVQVSSLSNVTAIAGGGYHSIALESDGTVWTWGYNWYGQLGDGTTTQRTTPVQVSGLSDVTAIAGGGYHSIALKLDGTVLAWGYNGGGQLGDGTTTDRNIPVQMGGIEDINAIDGGWAFTVALKSDGTVWSSGAYKWFTNNGERGWYYYRTTMQMFNEISNVAGVAAGRYHYLTLKSDGTVWAWGDNWDGQLGDGTTEDRDTPVQVDNINLGASPDTFAPSGTVQISNGDDYTNSTSVTLNLSAADGTGVTGYYLSTSSKTPVASDPGWTSISSTANYSESVSYTLSSDDGSKTIYVWYKDDAGNISDSASDSIILDATAPTVSITSPTSDATYSTTNSAINLSGSASDSTSGVSSVAWANTTTGISGMAIGTTSWSVSSVNLSSGNNTITITATDNAGNASTDTLTVTYSAPTPTPTPATTKEPTVTTGSATNVTSGSATLNGTVNANGLSTTAWFEYGKTSGSYNNTSSTQSVTGSNDTSLSIGISGLSAGTKYYYKLVAKNSTGTSYGSENTFTTTSVSATPTPTPIPSTTWVTSIVDSDGSVGVYSSLALDSNGAIHISYYDSENDVLKYATNKSGEWNTFVIDNDGDVGKYTSLDIDVYDNVHISYYDTSNTDLKYATNETGSWDIFTISSSGNVGRYTSLAIDSSNNVHISYYDETNEDLKYITNETGSWVKYTVDSSGGVGKYSSLAIDSSENVHISYYDETNRKLKYSNNSSGSWSTETISDSNNVGHYTSITVDSASNVHISYYDDTNDDLKYTTNNTGEWITSTIDSDGNVGEYSSIALDSSGYVHISYYDSDNNNLLYTTNNSGTWEISTIDGNGITGGYTSLSIDNENFIHISYYDVENNCLRCITSATNKSSLPTPTATQTPTPTPTVTSATLIVQVTDINGIPIEGATVAVDGVSGVADSSGAATFTLETGDYTVTVSKEGYDTATVEATVTAPVTIQAVELSLSTCPEPDETAAEDVSVSPSSLKLSKGEYEDVIVTVTDEDGCPAEGVTVKRKLSMKNKKKIEVSPVSVSTDKNGEAVFTIRAKKSSGKASVKFSVSGVNDKLKVTVNLTD